jgi:hypothetical protein
MNRIVAVIEAGSITRWRNLGGESRVGTEYLDRFEGSESYNLQAAFLKF